MTGRRGAVQVSSDGLREVRDALERYEREVHRAPMTDSSKKTYLVHATNFVRWLAGDFEPGGTLRAKRW
jgi:hypothetical protein